MDINIKLDEWNAVKKQVNRNRITQSIENKRIYWVSVGQNVGSEVFGKDRYFTRPVLVLCVFFNDTFLGIPLSSKTRNKTGRLYYKFKDSKGKEQVALLGQIRVYDIKRAGAYLSKVDDETFAKIKEKLKNEVIR